MTRHCWSASNSSRQLATSRTRASSQLLGLHVAFPCRVVRSWAEVARRQPKAARITSGLWVCSMVLPGCEECWCKWCACGYLFQLKEQFLIVQTLRGLSGFGWDDATHMVEASDDVWDNYLTVSDGIVYILKSNLNSRGITVGSCYGGEMANKVIPPLWWDARIGRRQACNRRQCLPC